MWRFQRQSFTDLKKAGEHLDPGEAASGPMFMMISETKESSFKGKKGKGYGGG
jgi:hypothetical protein